MIAKGPIGIGPPNSSAMPVMTHGISSPRAAHATAYVECVCTTPPISGMFRYTYACAAVSLDGLRSLPGVPGTALPSRSHRIMFSGARSSYETPEGLITNRSAPGTRPETLPPVQMTRP